MRHKIAIGSLFIECNHFGGAPADIESFRRSELLYDSEVLNVTAGTIGGMLQRLQAADSALAPLLVATACPSRHVTADCYDRLKSELLSRLRQAGSIDGVLLALHGAAAAENAGDLEGDLLAEVRSVVGQRVPIVASLDHHAHVTGDMVEHTDALLAWETYPHRDAYETGQRAARMLLDILTGQLQPAMVMAKVPVLVSGVLGHTEGPGPFADVMRRAKAVEHEPGVYSTSAFLVHPYLDLPDMGGGGLVVTQGDWALAESLARELAMLYWSKRFQLEPHTCSPQEAIERGLECQGGPVLLVETADCCGGGAAGDSVATLRALLDAHVQGTSLVPVVDPQAAAECHAAGEGAEVSVELGHRVDTAWGVPLRVAGRVAKLSDGQFVYQGGIWEGREGNMGKAARLEIGNIQVCLASHATYEWCGEQFESLGMDARRASFVVVKNPMNFNLAYGAYARATFLLDTPGPTPPTLKHLRYQRVSRPYFPADPDIAGLDPTVLRSTNRP